MILLEILTEMGKPSEKLARYTAEVWVFAYMEAIGELEKIAETESMDPDQRLGVLRAIERLKEHPALQDQETEGAGS
jgi:hypothetical protein